MNAAHYAPLAEKPSGHLFTSGDVVLYIQSILDTLQPEPGSINTQRSDQQQSEMGTKATKFKNAARSFTLIVKSPVAPDAHTRENEARTKMKNHQTVDLVQMMVKCALEKRDEQCKEKDGVGVESTGDFAGKKSVGKV
jgi:hypothetical protein